MTDEFGRLVAAEALSWRDTPFIWGQAQKGRGCDCKGLVAGVARELGRPEADSVYGLHASHRPDRPVSASLLKEGLAALFDPVNPDELEPGDVLLIDLNGRTQHLAIVVSTECPLGQACHRAGNGTPCGSAVHAQLSPTDRVKESRMHALLKEHKLNSAWRWREA